MSDYGGYDTDEDFLGYEDEDIGNETEFYDLDAEVNGHDKDEEDIQRDRLGDALEEGAEKEDEEEGAEKEDDDDEEMLEEEETPVKGVSRVVPSSLRRTNPILTKFEYSYIISQRAMAIEHNSPLMNPETKLINSIDIAREETETGLNPIIIQRILPNGDIEEWKCSELRVPKNYV
jgi:DNA-directed RNA polymerase subunit K/omega